MVTKRVTNLSKNTKECYIFKDLVNNRLLIPRVIQGVKDMTNIKSQNGIRKDKTQMKIKFFNREQIKSKYDDILSITRLETNEEFENRVNSFIADKKVIDIKYQEATYGTYEEMDAYLTIMVTYEEVN